MGAAGPGLAVGSAFVSPWSLRFLLFSAFRAGALRLLRLRPSSRSASGSVLVASFACPRAAGAFAARWAGRLGSSVALRRSPGLWSVSVPVRLGSSRVPGSCLLVSTLVLLPGSAGVWSFLRRLRSSGLGCAVGWVSL